MINRAMKILLCAAVFASGMLAIRFRLVEPDEMAATCASTAGSSWCWLRTLAIQGFVYKLYGMVSVLAAVLAWLSRWRVFAIMAMAAGLAGVVLYDFELAAVGLMLGALCLMRRAAGARSLCGDPGIEQQTARE